MTRFGPIIVVALILTHLCWQPQPAFAQRDALQKLAASVDPSGEAAPHKLAHYIRCFRDAKVQDSRIMAFQVDAEIADDGAILLTGHIEFVEIRDALLTYLRHLGFRTVRDQIELLPSAQLVQSVLDS